MTEPHAVDVSVFHRDCCALRDSLRAALDRLEGLCDQVGGVANGHLPTHAVDPDGVEDDLYPDALSDDFDQTLANDALGDSPWLLPDSDT